jgi:ABC-2 type transport system ATP-binding protein
LGLDPHQVRTVRQLIQELGRERTILLSSHILPEVEMTCQRVLILHQGRIVAADTTDNLQRRMSGAGQVVAEIAAPPEALRACWEQMEEIEHFDMAPADGGYFRCALTPRPGVDLRPLAFDLVRARGWRLRELTHSRHSLEDIFVHLTRADREEETT